MLKTFRWISIRCVFAFGCALILFGCHLSRPRPEPVPPTVNGFVLDAAHRSHLRRVAVLPVESDAHQSEVAHAFQNALVTELRSLGCFEVVAVKGEVCQSLQTVRPATYHEQLLVELGHDYRADAALFVSVNDYHAFYPPRLAVTVHMVDTREAITLASVDGVWDASQENVAEVANAYFLQRAEKMTIPRGDLALRSPRMYQQFVAHQVVLALSGEPEPEPQPLETTEVRETPIAPAESVDPSGDVDTTVEDSLPLAPPVPLPPPEEVPAVTAPRR